MQKKCDHNIPETRKGAGPCDIKAEVKKRNGKPLWWCQTHGLDASRPDGTPMPSCTGIWYEAPGEEMRLQVDLDSAGQWALWGVLDPAISIGAPPIDRGSVHVHHRPAASASKTIDTSYDIVELTFEGISMIVEGMAARAYSVSELVGIRMTPQSCPRCQDNHIDELKFATRPHRKHQCNRCGRAFFDPAGPSVSNPLANLHDQLGLPPAPSPVRAPREIELDSAAYSAMAMWPSNRAILNTMLRPEEEGIHVHAWDPEGRQVVDDTFGTVCLDGDEVDEEAVRALAIQRAVAHNPIILAHPCISCGTAFISPSSDWIEPRTEHACTSCGTVNRTHRKAFLNPLGDQGS